MGLVRDTIHPFFVLHTDGAGGAALGTGETPGTEATPPAGAQNADTGGGGAPETVPYARFKEVNDRLAELRGYEEFSRVGYDPDSLGRLVQFEHALAQDPAESLSRLVDNLDLPDSTKDGIKAQLAAQDPEGAGRREPGAGGEGDEEPPAWAKPILEREREQREREAAQAQEAAEAQREATLNGIMDHWRQLDKADELETPEATMLAYIAANASNGSTIQEIAENARKDALEYREVSLRGAVAGVGNGSGSPRPVPGGAPPASGGVPLKNIKDATAAARQAIENGTLPGIGG